MHKNDTHRHSMFTLTLSRIGNKSRHSFLLSVAIPNVAAPTNYAVEMERSQSLIRWQAMDLTLISDRDRSHSLSQN